MDLIMFEKKKMFINYERYCINMNHPYILKTEIKYVATLNAIFLIKMVGLKFMHWFLYKDKIQSTDFIIKKECLYFYKPTDDLFFSSKETLCSGLINKYNMFK